VKAQITDTAVLHSVSPVDITSYLLSKGSLRKGAFRDVAGVWEYKGDEIIVPNDRQLADYAPSIATILAKLEMVENRSQLEIIKDIQLSVYDVIRVRNTSTEAGKGSLPIADSVKFITNTKEMILSAACSLVSKKACYLSRKPQQAEDYMKSVRFGQTEIGSFVITVLSPVSPELKSPYLTLIDLQQELPYEKKVIPALHQALAALNYAAREASESHDIAPFISNIENGVTSNLCDSIVNLNDTADGGTVEIGFTLSINRKNTQRLTPVVFEKEYSPILREASNKIKEIEPQPDQEITGFVVKLNRQTDEKIGQITIQDIQPDKQRYVAVFLNEPAYDRAIQAHKDQNLVKISGTVSRQGRGYALEPTGDLFIFPKEPTPPYEDSDAGVAGLLLKTGGR
jgi:hypothetical protein